MQLNPKLWLFQAIQQFDTTNYLAVAIPYSIKSSLSTFLNTSLIYLLPQQTSQLFSILINVLFLPLDNLITARSAGFKISFSTVLEKGPWRGAVPLIISRCIAVLSNVISHQLLK